MQNLAFLEKAKDFQMPPTFTPGNIVEPSMPNFFFPKIMKQVILHAKRVRKCL